MAIEQVHWADPILRNTQQISPSIAREAHLCNSFDVPWLGQADRLTIRCRSEEKITEEKGPMYEEETSLKTAG